MPTANILGVDINFEDEGQGFPVLFLHGLTGSLLSWDDQVPALTDRYRAVRYDCRGHGDSESPDNPAEYSQDVLVDEALGLIDALGLEKVNLCGLSMGGNIALNLAIKSPDRVNGAIIASTGSGSGSDDGFLDRCNILAEMLDRGDLDSFARAMMAAPTAQTLAKVRPDFVEVVNQRRMNNNPRGLANTIRGVQMKRRSIFSLGDELRNLAVPTLILVGELDDPCREPANFMSEHIPDSRLVVLPDTGHSINIERPDDFNREMLGFFDPIGFTAS